MASRCCCHSREKENTNSSLNERIQRIKTVDVVPPHCVKLIKVAVLFNLCSKRGMWRFFGIRNASTFRETSKTTRWEPTTATKGDLYWSRRTDIEPNNTSTRWGLNGRLPETILRCEEFKQCIIWLTQDQEMWLFIYDLVSVFKSSWPPLAYRRTFSRDWKRTSQELRQRTAIVPVLMLPGGDEGDRRR